MNTDTGQIYKGLTEIEAVRLRGEPLAAVGPCVVELIEAGQRALEEKTRPTNLGTVRNQMNRRRKSR